MLTGWLRRRRHWDALPQLRVVEKAPLHPVETVYFCSQKPALHKAPVAHFWRYAPFVAQAGIG
jgi:hypothetical protein